MLEELKRVIIEVNESLKYYEPEFCSVKRSPVAEKERIHTFRQFIECRLNYELFEMPELGEIAREFDGHFFTVMSVVGQDEKRKRFSEVEAYMNKSLEYYEGQDLLESIEKVEKILGGTTIRFTYSKKRPKIYIEK